MFPRKAPNGVGKHQSIDTSNKTVELMEQGSKKAASKTSVTTVGSIGDPEQAKKKLTFFALILVLKPFFWPNKGTDGALINRIRSTSTWLMVACSKATSLYAPYFISNATDALVNGKYITAVNNIILYAAFRFAASVFKELQGVIYVKVKQQAAIELAELTFVHIHMLSLNWHLSKKTGSVIKSMDRGIEAANTLITYLFLFLIPAIAECLAVVVLFFSDFSQWSLGLVVFAGVLTYSVATVGITQWRKKYRENQNKYDNDFHDKATDSIINYETVKYFTAEDHELSRYKNGVVKFQQFNSMTSISLSLLNVTQQLVLALTLLGCMLISAKAVINGKMTLGGFVAVQAWIAQIFIPLNFLGTVYAMIFQGFIDVTNLSELLSESPDIVDEPGAVPIPISNDISADMKPTDKMIEFKNVIFSYPSQDSAKGLRDLSFSIRPGSITAFVGHTGAGKTTIARLLFRFYDPSSGSINIGGHNIKKYTQRSLRNLIGIIPQDTVLFNDSILYNIQYGRRDAGFDEIVACAKAAQIYDFIESLPEKWETVVGERGLKLSGGEKQRVSIARCLLKNPRIVVLDEATSALDSITENSVQLALNQLGTNRTVLCIAHRLSTIRNADTIIVLGNGSIIESGSHEELFAKKGQYYNLWTMQDRPSSPDMVELASPIEDEVVQ